MGLVQIEFLMPKKLTFRSTNTYYEMMKPGMGTQAEGGIKSQ